MNSGLASDAAGKQLKIPRVGWRVAVGGLIAVAIYIGMVGVPSLLFNVLASHGITVPISATGLTLIGSALAILSGAQYALKPSRIYGPVSIATALLEIFYLLLFATGAPIRLPLGGGGASTEITIAYATIVALMIVISLISLAANIVTTLEDVRHPGERLWWTYPLR